MSEKPQLGSIVKMLGCATLAAPLVAPIVFVYYMGYKSTKFAFQKPTRAIFGTGLVALISYAACHRDATQRHMQRASSEARYFVQQTIERMNDKRIATLEEKLKVAQQVTPTVSESAPTPAYTQPQSISMQSDENFNFYYVKQDETLSGIAAKVFGDRHAYRILEQDNSIADPRALLTGQLLLVRKSSCHESVADLYTKIPVLQSRILRGTQRISDVFPSTYNQVLELNAELGLNYTDTFRYPQGARVVYYREN